MIVLDEEKLTSFLTDVAGGFVRSPLQIALFALLLAAFVAMLVFFYRLQVRRNRREKALRAAARYEARLRRVGLNPSEEDLLERLSVYLRDPDNRSLLLEHPASFNAAAERMKAEQAVSDASLSALRLKLGFRAEDPERVPHSSSELPEGRPVLVVPKDGTAVPGRVLHSDPGGLVISFADGQTPSATSGTQVKVYFQNRSGLFGFTTHVQAWREGRLQVAHCERLRRVQRRRFYRRQVSLPVQVRPAGSTEPAEAGVLIDLGGGGASLRNPSGRLQVGQEIELAIPIPEDDSSSSTIRLTGRLVRTSREGRVAHLAFASVSDAVRDRIVGYLFRAPQGGEPR